MLKAKSVGRNSGRLDVRYNEALAKTCAYVFKEEVRKCYRLFSAIRERTFDLLAFENRRGVEKVSEVISIVSFVMAVIGALAAVFINNRDKQTMAAVVGVAFLVSFFINVSKTSQLILQAACIIAFIISVIGGTVAIFSNEESKRSGAIVTGVVSLGTSLLILFSYLGFHPF